MPILDGYARPRQGIRVETTSGELITVTAAAEDGYWHAYVRTEGSYVIEEHHGRRYEVATGGRAGAAIPVEELTAEPPDSDVLAGMLAARREPDPTPVRDDGADRFLARRMGRS